MTLDLSIQKLYNKTKASENRQHIKLKLWLYDPPVALLPVTPVLPLCGLFLKWQPRGSYGLLWETLVYTVTVDYESASCSPYRIKVRPARIFLN